MKERTRRASWTTSLLCMCLMVASFSIFDENSDRTAKFLVQALSTSKVTTGRPYCINVACEIESSRRDEFIGLIKENQKKTLETEDYALQYTVGEDIDKPNVFYIHEQFGSEAGFEIHRGTPHNANWQAFKETSPFVSSPVIQFYHGTHDPASSTFPDGLRQPALCLNVELNIDDSFRDEFIATIEQNALGSNTKEPLCLQYVWGEDASTPNCFHFHEQYESQEGFEQHQAAPHFQVWETFAKKDPFTKPPVVQIYKTL